MKSEPKLSVIVPVYNVEKYLASCLDSLLIQTYRNIEIICVDDKSSDESARILERYATEHSNIKILNYEKNRGIFAACVTGLKAMTGDYFTFCYSNDTVTLDFYRSLVSHAENNKCDIVAGDFVEIRSDGAYYPNRQLQQCEYILNNEEILDSLIGTEGLDWGWTVVWNKIYSKVIIEDCLDYLTEIADHQNFTTCFDVFLTMLLFSKAKHFENVHGEFYNKSSIIPQEKDKPKDMEFCFSILTDFFKQKNLFEKYEENLKNWKALYCDSKFRKENAELCNFFDSHYVKMETFPLQEIKSAIASEQCKCVSFDIFDTLVTRPFWEPYDLFTYMEPEVTKITGAVTNFEFKQIRMRAEQLAREEKYKKQKTHEILFDEIYIQLRKMCSAIDTDMIEKIKQLELDTELKFIQPRSHIRELVEFSRYLRKKVVCVSDMYLPKSFIEKMLEKCGVTDLDGIFVSGEYLATKENKKLFVIVEAAFCLPPNSFLHLGDNFNADVEKAKNAGWNAFYIPKCSDCMKNMVQGHYYGAGLVKTYWDKNYYDLSWNFSPEANYLGTRCMLAVQAIKLFNNPFVPVHNDSDFNASPSWLGYFTLGPFLLSFGTYIAELYSDYKYNQINFVARDGYLLLEAFRIIAATKKMNVKTNYIYTSRKAVAIMWLANKNTMYSLLHPNYSPESMSPRKYIDLFFPVIEEKKLNNAKKIIEQEGLKFNQPLFTVENMCKFSNIFIENFYNKKLIDSFVEKLKRFYEKDFIGHTLVVDVGYSCRFESTLKNIFDFDVDACYLHIGSNNEPFLRSKESDIKIFTLYNYSPIITGLTREIQISKLAPSCVGFDMSNGVVEPIFENFKHNAISDYVIKNLQNNGIQFVFDFCKIFGEEFDKLPWKKQEACLPLEIFLHHGQNYDRNIFSVFPYENDVMSTTSTLMEEWNNSYAFANTKYHTVIIEKRASKLSKLKRLPQKMKKGWSFFQRNGLKKTIKKTLSVAKRFLKN